MGEAKRRGTYEERKARAINKETTLVEPVTSILWTPRQRLEEPSTRPSLRDAMGKSIIVIGNR
jgi:hypothetical protein